MEVIHLSGGDKDTTITKTAYNKFTQKQIDTCAHVYSTQYVGVKKLNKENLWYRLLTLEHYPTPLNPVYWFIGLKTALVNEHVYHGISHITIQQSECWVTFLMVLDFLFIFYRRRVLVIHSMKLVQKQGSNFHETAGLVTQTVYQTRIPFAWPESERERSFFEPWSHLSIG